MILLHLTADLRATKTYEMKGVFYEKRTIWTYARWG